MNDKEVLNGLSAVDALAVCIYGEARGERIEGQIAVGCVVRNRVRAADHLKTYQDIIFAPAQFSCFSPKGGEDNYIDTLAAARQLLDTCAPGKHGIPDNLTLRQCHWIATGILTGALLDNTKGATNYHAAYMDPFPSWAAKMDQTAKIGNHLFYRERVK